MVSHDSDYHEMVGPESGCDTKQKRQLAARLYYTFHEVFCEKVRDMPVTDIIEHRIPSRSTAKPRMCNLALYSETETKYQDKFLRELLDANIITRITSPWSSN